MNESDKPETEETALTLANIAKLIDAQALKTETKLERLLEAQALITETKLERLIDVRILKTEKMISEVKKENERHGRRYVAIDDKLSLIIKRLDKVELILDIDPNEPVDPIDDTH